MALAGGWKQVRQFLAATGDVLFVYRRGDEFLLTIDDGERDIDLPLTRAELSLVADMLEDAAAEG